MQKGCTLVGLLLVAGIASAQADEQVGSRGMDQKIKEIQGRLDIIEKDIKDIKIRGKLEDLPLKQPNLTSEELLKWVTDSIVEVYSYNFLNYQMVLNKIRPYFTDLGYESYIKALEDSKNLEAVKNKKLVVNAIPTAKAAIVKEGALNAVYTWEIQIPLLVSYQSGEKEMQQRIMVNIEVVREPYAEADKGVAIHSITAKVVSSESIQPTTNSHEIKTQESNPLEAKPQLEPKNPESKAEPEKKIE